MRHVRVGKVTMRPESHQSHLSLRSHPEPPINALKRIICAGREICFFIETIGHVPQPRGEKGHRLVMWGAQNLTLHGTTSGGCRPEFSFECPRSPACVSAAPGLRSVADRPNRKSKFLSRANNALKRINGWLRFLLWLCSGKQGDKGLSE